MRVTAKALAFVLVVGPYATTPGQAEGLCRERCYAWCSDHGRGSSCTGECVGRPRCGVVTGKRLVGKSCYDWCATNKPGSAECKADCAQRR